MLGTHAGQTMPLTDLVSFLQLYSRPTVNAVVNGLSCGLLQETNGYNENPRNEMIRLP